MITRIEIFLLLKAFIIKLMSLHVHSVYSTPLVVKNLKVIICMQYWIISTTYCYILTNFQSLVLFFLLCQTWILCLWNRLLILKFGWLLHIIYFFLALYLLKAGIKHALGSSNQTFHFIFGTCMWDFCFLSWSFNILSFSLI